jgi:hypothetical protein
VGSLRSAGRVVAAAGRPIASDATWGLVDPSEEFVGTPLATSFVVPLSPAVTFGTCVKTTVCRSLS